jgi:hypothetical protein
VFLHPAGVAGWVEASLAGEGHQSLETAVGTANPGEAAAQEPAVEGDPEGALDEGREAAAAGAALPGGGEEGLEPVSDDGVEEGLLGFPAPIPRQGGAGRAVAAFPALGRRGGVVHARR